MGCSAHSMGDGWPGLPSGCRRIRVKRHGRETDRYYHECTNPQSTLDPFRNCSDLVHCPSYGGDTYITHGLDRHMFYRYPSFSPLCLYPASPFQAFGLVRKRLPSTSVFGPSNYSCISSPLRPESELDVRSPMTSLSTALAYWVVPQW